MGWLCGQCKEGYNIVFGITDCYQCSNTLHSALAISFGILGGIVYVLVLFSLRLTIDLGTLGGFIFWLNNIWPYNVSLFEVGNKTKLLQYIGYLLTSIKYQWNIPVCITNNLNQPEMTTLLYFFPLYLWAIVAAIVLISQCSTRIANLTVGSSVQVLVTLMYISYPDLLSHYTFSHQHTFIITALIVLLNYWFGLVMAVYFMLKILSTLFYYVLVLYFYLSSFYLLHWLDCLELRC